MATKYHFSIGAFPLSDVSLMTDEERETYLPTVKAFIKVLENDKIDQDDLDNLIEEGEKIQELMPDHWKAIISQTINENFVEEIGRARRNQEAIENARYTLEYTHVRLSFPQACFTRQMAIASSLLQALKTCPQACQPGWSMRFFTRINP